jgi:hypothetical protein
VRAGLADVRDAKGGFVRSDLFPRELPTTARGLRCCYGIARRRVDDARTIGWPALEASWRVTLTTILEQMARHGVAPPTHWRTR